MTEQASNVPKVKLLVPQGQACVVDGSTVLYVCELQFGCR